MNELGDPAAFLREKAAQCRRLADRIANDQELAVLTLRAMASEFEAKAAAEAPRYRRPT
ncbi:MAG TPA: hypothetical protein VGL83_20960 [Stellaceae bacterium]|jgi:hypothetical protein